MIVNKKLDRFKQWAGERMGGEVKTNVSDDFKALETEMALRHEGMEKMQRAMNLYVKSVSKRTEIEEKEKPLPIAFLGATMIAHGEDFEPESEFGQCLTTFGRTQERMARTQEAYIADATTSWLESTERSLAQMKEYQTARKKLETRRLAYDTSLAKMQKAKKEDFRVEEELRSQRAKYEETEDDVHRRMQEIKASEDESMAELTAFLEAELTYHEKCRQALLQLKNQWPARSLPRPRETRVTRSRANTGLSYGDPMEQIEEAPQKQDVRPPIKSNRTTSFLQESPARDHGEVFNSRPTISRTTTYDLPAPRRDTSPLPVPRPTRMPSDSLTIRTTRNHLRSIDPPVSDHDIFNDDSAYSTSSPEHSHGNLSVSPATSHSSSGVATATITSKKGPPPAVPSRAKKPPPPPPPSKRTLLA